MDEEIVRKHLAECGIEEASTAAYLMYCYKVLLCPKRFSHDWGACPFAHSKENARRRDPCKHVYSSTMCPSIEGGGSRACRMGVQCPYSHHLFEAWLHPARFRTQMCNAGRSCRRSLCFFAHSPSELRVAPPPPQQQQQQQPLPACTLHAGSVASPSRITAMFSAMGLGGSSTGTNSSGSNASAATSLLPTLSITSSSGGSWAMMVEPRSDSNASMPATPSRMPVPAGSSRLFQAQPQAQLLMLSQPQQLLVPSQPQQLLVFSQPQQLLPSQPQQLLVPCNAGMWSASIPVAAASVNTPFPAQLCYTAQPVPGFSLQAPQAPQAPPEHQQQATGGVAVIGLEQLTTLTDLPW